MLVVLLGAPECGKTTQAERISAALGLAKVHIADVGGNDASDAELAASVADLAAGDRCAAGLTLEGFPSTLAQADALDDALGAKGMKVSKVVYIDVGECEWLEQADPLLSMYFDRGVLTAVDGRPFVEAVEEQIMAGLADVMAPAEPAGGNDYTIRAGSGARCQGKGAAGVRGRGGGGAVDRPAVDTERLFDRRIDDAVATPEGVQGLALQRPVPPGTAHAPEDETQPR